MLTISDVAKQKKNSLTDTGSWLILLDISNQDDSIHIRICSNTDDVTWDGETYLAFPFDLDEVTEATKGQLPTVALKVANVERVIQGYVETDPNFGSGWDVKLRVFHSSNLDVATTAEIELDFTTLNVGADETFVTFQLGMPNPIRMQFPHRKYLPNSCQHVFKKGGCNYAGSDTTCGKTLADCRVKFGGADRLPILIFPGTPVTAIYK